MLQLLFSSNNLFFHPYFCCSIKRFSILPKCKKSLSKSVLLQVCAILQNSNELSNIPFSRNLVLCILTSVRTETFYRNLLLTVFSIFEGKRQIKSCTFFATLNIALRENPKNNACLQIK